MYFIKFFIKFLFNNSIHINDFYSFIFILYRLCFYEVFIECRTHFTLQCCNNKTGLGVYQRYYSFLCNMLSYSVKQREALYENYRIRKSIKEKKNYYKMYYWILCALWFGEECERQKGKERVKRLFERQRNKKLIMNIVTH